MAGLGLVMLFSAPGAAVAPGQPLVVPDAAFQPVVVAPTIHDTFPAPTLAPRPAGRSPAAKPIVERIPRAPARVDEAVGLPSVADARAYALARLGVTQFSCLDQLFERESGWRVHATNSSSGAYGIPQALPGSKMAVIADDWQDNPITQVRWGIRYVNGRYGSACQAWGYFRAVGWY